MTGKALSEVHHQSAEGNTGVAAAFAVGAVVMLAGLLSEEIFGATDLDVWPWMVGAGIAVSLGLVWLAQSMRPEAPAVRVLATVAGIGATVYVLTTLGFRTAAAADVALPPQLEGLFALSALLFLTCIVLACALAGVTLMRTDGVSAHAGMLLVGVGLLFLSSLTGLLAADPPSWLPTVSVTLLALLLLALTQCLRAAAERAE